MTVSEARKELKKLGFNLRTKTFSWGPNAIITNEDRSEDMPSIFTEETRLEWLPAIEWKHKRKLAGAGNLTTSKGERVYGP